MSKLSVINSFWRNREDFKDIFTREKFDALIRMFPLIFKGEYKPQSKSSLVLGAAALIYVISPMDFLPEFALGPIGVLDDIVLLAFAVRKIDTELNNFLAWEEVQKDTLFVD